MGACMSKKDQVYQPRQKIVTNEASLLLDQWNEKHIEILKNRFAESMAGRKNKGKGLDKQAFFQIFADLKDFPRTVAESAFKMFDRDQSGFIDFREFCCALSIICLSGTNEKIRFVFDLFDQDKDGLLSKHELKNMLDVSVMSFRKFSTGPGDQIDKGWIDYHYKQILQDQGITVTGKQEKGEPIGVDFNTFKKWAANNLNVYHLLNTFELVPSPVRERRTIFELTHKYERKHGDRMYVLSYKWWDMWKAYTKMHETTQEQVKYIENMKEHLDKNLPVPQGYLEYEEEKDDFNQNIEFQNLIDIERTKEEHLIQTKGLQTPKTPRTNMMVRGPFLDMHTPKLGLGDMQIPKIDRNSSQISVYDKDDNFGNSQSFKQVFNFANLGQRPQEIDNTELEGEQAGQLKQNLMVNRDFVLLPQEAYLNLERWYGGGPAFARTVIFHNGIPTIELYPPLITSVLAGRDGHPVSESQRQIFVSIAMKLSEVFYKICESYNQLYTKDTRLWFKADGKDWELIKQDDMNLGLEDFIVKDGDVFMIEMKFGDIWARDIDGPNETVHERDWRQFEVGDKVDVLIDSDWKPARIVKTYKDKVQVHSENSNWRQDLTLPKDSDQLEKYGIHTFDLYYKTIGKPSDEIPKGVFGLDNIGNTCYMNAAIQPVIHMPLLRDFFINKMHLDNVQPKKVVGKEVPVPYLAEVFGDLIHEGLLLQKMAPIQLKKIISDQLPMFYGNLQHDAQEFLISFLDKLSDELNHVEAIEQQESEVKEESKKKEPESPPKKQTDNEPEIVKQEQPEEDGEVGGTGNQPQKPVVEEATAKVSIEEGCSLPPLPGAKPAQKIIDDDNIEGLPDPNSDRKEEEEDKKMEPSPSAITEKNDEAINIHPHEQIYNSFFQPKVNPKDSVKQGSPGKNTSSSGFGVANTGFQKLSDPEKKSELAWEQENNNSAISDILKGQQITTIECQECKNKTYNFESFLTLSIPLPYQSKTIFYVQVVLLSSEDVIPPIVKYGLHLNKSDTLIDLATELERVGRLKIEKSCIVEIMNSKIFRSYDDPNLSLNEIRRMGNELVAYEFNSKINHFTQMPGKLRQIRSKDKYFKSMVDLQIGMILDAQDYHEKWFAGIIVDREIDRVSSLLKVKIHFYEFLERWDEWYTEESLNKLAPFGTYAEEPKDKPYGMTMTHRKDFVISENRKETQTFGLPLFIGIPNWYVWPQMMREIMVQVQRFVKIGKDTPARSQRSIQLIDENISDFGDDVAEERKQKMENYDSSVFSKKLQNIEKPTQSIQSQKINRNPSSKSQIDLQADIKVSLDHSQNRYKTRQEQLQTDREKMSKSIVSNKGAGGTLSALDNMEDEEKLPFSIFILDAETHRCAICTFKNKYTKQKTKSPVKCFGCDLPTDNEKVKWILGCFKRLEIVIHWNNPAFYKEAMVSSDMSTLKLQQQEKELKSGFPLTQCFDLFSKKEQLEGYDCDKCKKKTTAHVGTKISKTPDVLVVHLKRFAFMQGYLEKIEDLISYPIQNLDITKYISPYIKPQFAQYDLYGVVNHMMLSMGGGHYTSHILTKDGWFSCNDSDVQKADKNELVNKDAYILFFKKKEFSARNVVNFKGSPLLFE